MFIGVLGSVSRGALIAAMMAGAPAFAQSAAGLPEAGDQTDAVKAAEETYAPVPLRYGSIPNSRAITVTATRTPITVIDAPATVSVIDAEQIAQQLVTDVKDLVRYEPGVSVPRSPAQFGAALGSTGRDRNSGFTIRGLGGNRVLIQVDGIRVPDGFGFGAQLAGRGDYVDVGLVKSVEILRGPASALYGSDGLAGAVSFITSDPADFLGGRDGIAGLARASYSSADEEFSETAVVAGASGQWSAMAAYTRRDFKELDNHGENDVTGPARTTPNPQDGESNALLGKLVWGDGDHRIRLTGEHLDTRVTSDVLSGITAAVARLDARDSVKRDRVGLDWTWEGSGTIDHASLGAYWQNGRNRQFTFEDRTVLADRERLNTFDNRVIGTSGELRGNFATGAIAHRFVLGADYSETRQEGLRDGTVPPAGEVFPTRAFPVTDFTLLGLFAGDEIAIGTSGLTLYPALRFDYYKLDPCEDTLLPNFPATGQDGSRVSPKFGALWKVGGGVNLFGQYAQGFKAPAPTQVNQFFENLAFGYTSEANPDLKPETSRTFEGGIRYGGEAVDLSLTAFTGRYRNFISQEVVGGSFTPTDPAVYQFINLDRVKISGAEARLHGRMPAGFTGTLALSYAKGDVIDPSGARTPLVSVDPLKLVAGIGWRATDDRFGGDVTMTHSAGKSEARSRGLCTPSCYLPDAFTIVDATAFVRIGEALTLRAGIFNILDAKYAWWSDVAGLASTTAIADAFTQPGRNASVSISARF